MSASRNKVLKSTFKKMLFGIFVNTFTIAFACSVRCIVVYGADNGHIGLHVTGFVGGIFIFLLILFFKPLIYCARTEAITELLEGIKNGNENMNDDEKMALNSKIYFNPPVIKIKYSIGESEFVDYVPYKSWSLDTVSRKIRFESFTFLNVNHNIKVTQPLATLIENRKQYIRNALVGKGIEATVEHSFEIHNLTDNQYYIGSSRIARFVHSEEGRVLMVFLDIIGLYDIIENIYGTLTKNVTLNVERTLSLENDLPIPAFMAKDSKCDSFKDITLFDVPQIPNIQFQSEPLQQQLASINSMQMMNGGIPVVNEMSPVIVPTPVQVFNPPSPQNTLGIGLLGDSVSSPNYNYYDDKQPKI